ncbi:MAG TPA: DoxX family protein [Marmoricola sp.]
MESAYWIVAALLALLYVYSGGMKLTQSQEKLTPMMPWAGVSVPMAGVRLIGLLEVAGAAGLILPPLFDVRPHLAVIAAICLAVLQVCATVFHAVRGELSNIWLNVILIAMAVLAAWLGGVF